MNLPTPECPRCHRTTEDRGSYFACAHCLAELERNRWLGELPFLPTPAQWYEAQAASFGCNAATMMGMPWPMLAAVFEATMAARCAFRMRPELRG